MNLNPITVKEHECPNKFNLKYTDEYFCINDDDKEEKESNESGENSGTTATESTFSPVTPQCNLNERYFYQNKKYLHLCVATMKFHIKQSLNFLIRNYMTTLRVITI